MHIWQKKGLRFVALSILAAVNIIAFNNCTKKSEKAPDPVITSQGCALSGVQVAGPSPTWIRYENNPVLVPGTILAPFSQHSINIADPSVMYDEIEGIWKMWYANAFDQNDNYAYGTVTNSRVGLSYATSRDGFNWCVDSYGVLMPTSVTGGSSSDWDYTNVETPTVIKNPDTNAPTEKKYMMWYSGGNTSAASLSTGHPFYQIGLAFSADGRSFTRLASSESPYGQAGLVLKSVDTVPGYPAPAIGVAADPHVIYKSGTFHLWFSNITYTNASGTTMQTAGISYASSSNGKNWTPYAANPLTSLWRAGVAVGWQPSVLWNSASNQYEMWFSADTDTEKNALSCASAGVLGFYKATSSDGLTWTPNFTSKDFTADNSKAEESCNLITGVEVVKRDSNYFIYYSSYGTKNIPPVLSAAGYPVIWSLSVSYR